MKTKLNLFAVLAIVLSSCSAPKYLPKSDEIDVSTFGSYIDIDIKSGDDIEGELIAFDSNAITVLTIPNGRYRSYLHPEIQRKCITVPIKNVNKFTVRYAQPEHYGWTIPFYTLATISHGFLLLITAPLNIIVTTSVTVAGEQAFTYNNSQISLEDLEMFARFPQGIPKNIDVADLK